MGKLLKLDLGMVAESAQDRPCTQDVKIAVHV